VIVAEEGREESGDVTNAIGGAIRSTVVLLMGDYNQLLKGTIKLAPVP
jgi:hypothetical protein